MSIALRRLLTASFEYHPAVCLNGDTLSIKQKIRIMLNGPQPFHVVPAFKMLSDQIWSFLGISPFHPPIPVVPDQIPEGSRGEVV